MEPIDIPFDVKAWFAKLDEYLDEPFMPQGHEQPPLPPAREVFDDDDRLKHPRGWIGDS